MDITLIALSLFILLAILFLLIFLFRGISQKSFKANDGSVFDNESDLNVYQNIYEKTKPLFVLDLEKTTDQPVLGFDKSFLIQLTQNGFSDLKTLITYRKQIKALSDLINP